MPRSKPYTKNLAIADAILLVVSGGAWLFVMLVRELYRFAGPKG